MSRGIRRLYEAIESGWVAGVRVSPGDRLELTHAEAKYERVAPVPDAFPPPQAGRRLRRQAPE